MQKNELKLGVYHLLFDPEKTKKQYENLPLYQKDDLAQAFFHHVLKKGKEESLAFLQSLGLDLEKLTVCRPVAPPDENGEVIYLCCAPLCGTLLQGGDISPRKSEEVAGLSVIFVGDEGSFTKGLPEIEKPCVEMRFVIPLPFDETFLQDK